MALYTIGDLHLSLAADKPMDVFGGAWKNYVEKIQEGFRRVSEGDTVLLCGDNSWGLSLDESLLDFQFIHALPGRKLLLKGNHDYFWSTASKMHRFWAEHDLTSLDILHNNAHMLDGAALCGTRGWFFDEKDDPKIFQRELHRLRASLEAGRKLNPVELLCFLHYPPLYEGYRCDEIVDMLNEFGVKRCYYGHLHGFGCQKAIEGDYMGIEYHLVSGDHLGFVPLEVNIVESTQK